MDGEDLATRFEALQQRYTDLLKEHERTKCFVGHANAEIKLAIFDLLPMPIWACDRNCRIVFWNAGAARLYGYSADEAIGQDFVALFVNKPEQERARLDCIDIIDNNKPIRNMADDIDRHGNTRRLVTQCFAVYNVEGHSGLQVELSYEVQDIDRLREELASVQDAYRRSEADRQDLHHKLVDVTRTRALAALAFVYDSAKQSLSERRKALEIARVSKDANAEMIAKVRNEIKAELERLIAWERRTRNNIMSLANVEELEELVVTIERTEGFDV